MNQEDKISFRDLCLRLAVESEPVSEDEPLGRPPGFIPEVALSAFYKLTTTGVLELLIYRTRNGEEYEFYYQDREDQDWNGFAVVGGFLKPHFPQDPVAMAQKIIDREFAGLGITVTTLQVVAPFLWKREHPWANPFVTTCVVEVEGSIPEGLGRWIAVSDLKGPPGLPRPVVVHHADYIRQADYFLRKGALIFTPTQRMGVPGLEVPVVPDHPKLGQR